MLYSGIKFLHILAMATWIGAAAVAPLGMRRSLELGTGHAVECVRRLRAATTLIVIAALATVVTGFALMQFSGGWSGQPTRIRAGTGLTLLVFLLGATASRPTLNRLRAHFAAGGDAASARPLRRQFLSIAALEMSLRTVVLALMVFPL